MDRIFHARIHLYMYIFLSLLTLGAGFALWHKAAVHAVILMLLLVAVIERIIHTTYTLTADGRLVVSHGRFSRSKAIALTDIRRVEKCRLLRWKRKCLMSYLLVIYGAGEKGLAVMPVNEDDFLETLTKRRRQCKP